MVDKKVNTESDSDTTPGEETKGIQWIVGALNEIEASINTIKIKVDTLPTKADVQNTVEQAINNHTDFLRDRYTSKKWIYKKSWVAFISIASLILLAANLYSG